MSWLDNLRAFFNKPIVEILMFAAGVLLIALSPAVGILPGPGGIFVFAAGLALVLKTSMWAKRNYVRFKRWKPQFGRWADWGLRRQSAKRREARVKETKHGQQRELANVPEGAAAADLRIAEQRSPPAGPAGPRTAAELAREMDARLQGNRPGN